MKGASWQRLFWQPENAWRLAFAVSLGFHLLLGLSLGQLRPAVPNEAAESIPIGLDQEQSTTGGADLDSTAARTGGAAGPGAEQSRKGSERGAPGRREEAPRNTDQVHEASRGVAGPIQEASPSPQSPLATTDQPLPAPVVPHLEPPPQPPVAASPVPVAAAPQETKPQPVPAESLIATVAVPVAQSAPETPVSTAPATIEPARPRPNPEQATHSTESAGPALSAGRPVRTGRASGRKKSGAPVAAATGIGNGGAAIPASPGNGANPGAGPSDKNGAGNGTGVGTGSGLAGGSGNGVGPGGTGSGTGSSGSGGDPPDSYFKGLLARIDSAKRYPRFAKERGQQGKVALEFILSGDGKLKEARVAGSSGSSLLDQAAIATLRRAGPFPPVPGRRAAERVPIRLVITYELLNEP